MSTDMAISLSKKFIRQISQPWDHTQTGISLWTLADIEARQAKEKEEMDRAEEEVANAFGRPPAAIDGEAPPDEMDLDAAQAGLGSEEDMRMALDVPFDDE